MGKWLKSCEHIAFRVEGAVGYITLNRPHVRNALSWDLLVEYRNALLEADDLTGVGVVVVAGAGDSFCAGYDMKAAYQRYGQEEAGGPSVYRTGSGTFDDDAWKLERFQELLQTPLNMHKPVIAKVHGHCVAGGTDLALYCDLILAADTARIGYPATRAMGSPPNQMWIYHVGPQWAKRLLLTGDVVLGRDAARLGLVLDAVPASSLDQVVDDLARRMAHIDPELLSANKRIVNLALEVAGARTVNRLAAETDARAHLSKGKQAFDEEVRRHGFKAAFQQRDAAFGDGVVRPHWCADDGSPS